MRRDLEAIGLKAPAQKVPSVGQLCCGAESSRGVNYCEAVDHPEVFGRWFADPSWDAWKVVERSIFGLPIFDDDLALFRELTGREDPPTAPATECWIIAGRRSAKSRKAAAIAVYTATIGAEVAGYRQRLASGERGVVLVLAVDRAQAAITLDYAKAFLREIPMFAAMIERDAGDGVDLTNRMSLIVAANDFRSIRGRTLVSVILDEVAYWRGEGSQRPDLEVYRAVLPGLASMPGAMLIGISSPYRKSGLLWQKFRKHWGKPGPVLVVKATTEQLNPTINRQIIAAALEDDPAAARAEWLSEFRSDIADYVSREIIEGLVSPGVHERPPRRGCRYFAFADPAGGSGADSFTLAIAARVGECAELALVRERRPPFSPELVVVEFAELIRSYGLTRVVGDQYAGAWPAEQFSKRGVTYVPSDLPKSRIYLEALPLLNSGRVDLLDDDRMVNQICGLERRTARGGRDSIDHPVGGHDDLANSALGALRGVLTPAPLPLTW